MSQTLRTDEAAEYIGASKRAMIDWRRRGIGPDYIQPTERFVRYRVADLDAWLDANTVRSDAS